MTLNWSSPNSEFRMSSSPELRSTSSTTEQSSIPYTHSIMATPAKLRSIYRSFLRELPIRPHAKRSPLQARIRESIASDSATPIEQAEQFLQYVKAQRMYATLLERYNPGMNMDEEERVKLTARRVGMDLPVEYEIGKDDGKGE